MIKIMYLITRAERGGAQAHLADLLKGFHKDFDVSLLVGQEDFLTDHARALDVQVRILPDLVQPVAPTKDVQAVRQAVGIMRELKPDLVHCHSSKAGLVGRIVASALGISAVFTAHGWSFAEGVSRKRKSFTIPSEWLAAHLGQKIITVSEQDRKLALLYGIASQDKLVTIHNGVPDTHHRASPGQGETVRIAMVARFAPPKDHVLLLRALANTPSPPFEIFFIGDGPTRPDVEKEAASLGLQDQVKFLGTRNDVPELLSKAHIFVLPSNWEGFPISILEAMRAGLPVVASDVGGVSEAVTDGETGSLVPRGNVDVLRDRLLALLHNPPLRVQLGMVGRRRFESNFTFGHMLEKTLGVYDEVLAARRGGGDSRGIFGTV
jgi:glycosyltransferase involved in cell wall biosynthesis